MQETIHDRVLALDGGAGDGGAAGRGGGIYTKLDRRLHAGAGNAGGRKEVISSSFLRK